MRAFASNANLGTKNGNDKGLFSSEKASYGSFFFCICQGCLKGFYIVKNVFNECLLLSFKALRAPDNHHIRLGLWQQGCLNSHLITLVRRINYPNCFIQNLKSEDFAGPKRLKMALAFRKLMHLIGTGGLVTGPGS